MSRSRRNDGTTTGGALPIEEIERRLKELWSITNDKERERFLAHKDRDWVTHRNRIDNH